MAFRQYLKLDRKKNWNTLWWKGKLMNEVDSEDRQTDR